MTHTHEDRRYVHPHTQTDRIMNVEPIKMKQTLTLGFKTPGFILLHRLSGRETI